ncbi:hypothetical protein A1O3_05688 [Capronia epimyces CBS 606.96]|uniref:Mid2 domain-containing protein n=1 Tax=Capronia epimyces CBS 606.96 TaxID=1182542 RepID=W9XXQ8_9EURO|nr:uncharacterized protein A1O3_05688 [Capronia epimyces CBS 606.96]EXJ85013.1 hypothetical protein A1O3_05688 [Capronia epimyces CBS 606.96]
MRFWKLLVLAPNCISLTAAQLDTADPLEIFASEIYSVYTEATSILASAASVASAALVSTSTHFETSTTSSSSEASSTAKESVTNPEASADTISTSQSSPLTSLLVVTSQAVSLQHSQTSSSTSSRSSSSSAVSTLIIPTSALKTSSVLGAVAATGTADPSTSGSSSHSKNLAIILGSVLGALVMGMSILTGVLCYKRRRHRQSPRHRALPIDDDELESWRLPQPPIAGNRDTSFQGQGIAGAAPLMSEHPAFRNSGEQENPFVPVVPPPRRTAPSARAGSINRTVPGNDHFVLGKETAVPANARSQFSDVHAPKAETLAARLAVAAAREDSSYHRRESDTDEVLDEKPASEAEPRYKISRKPVPVNHINNGEPWPYSPVSPIDLNLEASVLGNIPPVRGSGEHRRSFSRDAARANAAFDNEYNPPDAAHGQDGAMSAGMAGFAAAATGSGALVHGRNSRQVETSTGGRDSPQRSRSPQRPPVMPHTERSEPRSSPGASRNIHGSSDASTRIAQSPERSDTWKNAPQRAAVPPAQPPQNGYQDSPRTTRTTTTTPPPRNDRRNSALGGTAPVGVSTGSGHINRPTVPSPLSSEVRRDRSHSPARVGSSKVERSNRSPRRRSGSRYSYSHTYNATPQTDYEPYPVDLAGVPGGKRDSYLPTPDEIPSLQGNLGKGIVGDSRYPRVRVPRRMSGAEDEYDSLPAGPSTSMSQSLGRDTAGRSTMNSDDSTWRLSSGMPAGWQRTRTSGDGGGGGGGGGSRPRTHGGGYMRDSGLGGIPGRKRPRASDFTGDQDRRYQELGVGQAL